MTPLPLFVILMRTFQVTLPHFYQMDTRDQTGLLHQMTSLFAGPLQHCRLLTVVTPASLQALERARRRLAMRLTDTWARRGLLEEVRLINDWGKRGTMRQTRHYLLDFNDALTVRDFAHWRVQAVEASLQLPITGDYAEHHDYLAPVIAQEDGGWRTDNSRPHYALLASYQLTRTWDWRHPLAQNVIGADGQMVICIDIRKIHPERVAAAAEFWQGMVYNQQDRNAHLSREEAEAALNVRDEAIHHVRLLYMLIDRNLDQLRERVDSLRKTSSQYMKVDRLLGYQGAAAKLFTPTARPTGLPRGHFNTLSRAPALFTGIWGVGRDQATDGYYMGLSVDEIAPHVYYIAWNGNNPFHGIILGRTGKGKTVAVIALAWRMAEQGVQIILLEPQGHSQRFLQLADGNNTSYSQISYETTRLNILDVVFENPTDQYDHVITLLSLLLDPLGNNPRRFANAEVAAIRRALQLTYARYDWETELLADHTLSPTLETLCHKLAALGDSAATAHSAVAQAATLLADEIASLYVYGDYARVFNVPTNLDLSLREQIVLFDFSQVPERRRALFYYATLAGINHQVRRNPRKRAVIVDEVNYMAQEASLMDFLANMVKTVRTFGAAVIMVDQDLEAFIGVDGAQAASMASGLNIAAGQFILNNVSWTVAFGMKRDAAYRLTHHYKDEILPSHAEFLAQMGSDDQHGQGMSVIRANGKADMVYWQLRPTEARHLIGS